MQDHGFLHQALVYLAAGVIVVPLAKRLGLGSVLGYLVAGVAIGPWGLALVSAPERALHGFGYGRIAARRIVTRFRRHDEEGLAQQARHRKDTKKLITLAQQGRQDLAQLLATEAGKKA